MPEVEGRSLKQWSTCLPLPFKVITSDQISLIFGRIILIVTSKDCKKHIILLKKIKSTTKQSKGNQFYLKYRKQIDYNCYHFQKASQITHARITPLGSLLFQPTPKSLQFFVVFHDQKQV